MSNESPNVEVIESTERDGLVLEQPVIEVGVGPLLVVGDSGQPIDIRDVSLV